MVAHGILVGFEDPKAFKVLSLSLKKNQRKFCKIERNTVLDFSRFFLHDSRGNRKE